MKKQIVPLGWFLFGLLIVSLVINIAMDQTFNKAISVVLAADIFGRAIVPVAAASLISIPWRLLERLFKAKSNGPVFVGLLVFLIVIIFVFKGQQAEQLSSTNSAPQITRNVARLVQLPDCEFTMSFPDDPEIAKMSTQIGGKLLQYQQASFAGPEEYLRAECLPFPMDQSAAILALQNQATADAIQYASVEEVSATVVRLRGYKNVQGTKATYLVEIHRGERSALVLLGAASSSKFPTKGISRFMSSVSKNN